MSEYKLKVCGMKDPGNILEVASLNPAYMGFIFYPPSKRFARELDQAVLQQLPPEIKKTGVFVNASQQEIEDKIKAFRLDAVQLHGAETPDICKALRTGGIEIIKAFGIDEHFDFHILEGYEDCTDYFLFDTKTKGHGGSGKAFDWGLLRKNVSGKKYFLSGGIDLPDIREIQQLGDPSLYALDLNSRFETEPGLKDPEKLRLFFKHINNNAANAATEDI
ncbi:phosphoribosylanthranilate isomerase [Pararcticibacter amylolyticus]|uniref:N-(5'-phosphoribosyl)anthranilate isomerase n=1 Tax=Pararcticibacter amylolyticus TaxID=2173175 RepID=A0A2U2PFV0_9SPHI|nr:phosphoribosylanthranilate isomerase [Pararcticibacter amylolyticus]PWG80142.1 N-(5'-phosphoribosyl)anthranilate isomerase [Pararcticibacter amylolyticus]